MWWPFVGRKDWNQMIVNIQELTDAVSANTVAVNAGVAALNDLVARGSVQDSVPQELIDSLKTSADSLNAAVANVPPPSV